jgi:hypothetical protein
MLRQMGTFEYRTGGMKHKVGSTTWAVVQLPVPIVLFTVAMALMVTGSGERIAVGAVILAFCIYRTVRIVLAWRAELRRERSASQ